MMYGHTGREASWERATEELHESVQQEGRGWGWGVGGLAANMLFKTATACSSSLFNDPFAPATSIPMVKIKRLKAIVRFVQA